MPFFNGGFIFSSFRADLLSLAFRSHSLPNSEISTVLYPSLHSSFPEYLPRALAGKIPDFTGSQHYGEKLSSSSADGFLKPLAPAALPETKKSLESIGEEPDFTIEEDE